MRICLIGGCINKQHGLALKKHYHFVLRNMFFTRFGYFPEVMLEKYQSYQNISKQIITVSDTAPAVIVLFLRPFPIYSMIKPLIRYKNTAGKLRIILHPVLNKSSFADNVMDEFENLPGPITHPLQGVLQRAAAHANNMLGRISGLDKWTLNYIENQIIIADNHCRSQGIKFIIAGPPMYPANEFVNRVCSELSNRVEQLIKNRILLHAQLYTQHCNNGQYIFESDKIHLNEHGHLMMAQTIFNLIHP